MRHFSINAFMAVLFLSGCASSKGVDALEASDSMITNSVRPPANMASADRNDVLQPKAGNTIQEGRHAAPSAQTTQKLAALTAPPVAPKSVKAIRRTITKPKFSDAKPVSFGKIEPHHYPVHGVDVSRWQGDINWRQLKKNGANFAYIKATEGGDYLDPSFKTNWRAAAKAGIPRGAYHFFYWCTVAEVQADWFIRNVPRSKGALPPVIDVEWNAHSKTCRKRPDRKTVLAKMKVFMNKIERHYGQKPVIYTAPDFYADNLRGQFKDYSFWLRAVAEHPTKVYPGRDFAFWQYSGTGLASGVDNHIDLNAFNGTKEGWKAWLSKRTR